MKSFFIQRNKGIYIFYFFIICLYMLFLQLASVPVSITRLLYFICIIYYVLLYNRYGIINNSKSSKDISLIMFWGCYYLLSILVYSVGVTGIEWVFKDLLCTVLPILFYIIVRKTVLVIDKNLVLLLTLATTVIFDIIGLMLLFFPNSSFVALFRQENFSEDFIFYALSSIIGVIFVGFLNVIGLIICVFSEIALKRTVKISLILLFVICIFLTGQRTPIGGIVIVLLIYLRQKKLKAAITASFIVAVLLFVLSNLSMEINGVSVKETMSERTYQRLNSITHGNTGRDDQYGIYNDDTILGILLGEGVGSHSPENPYTTSPMPDAMYFRIFNEMGLVGLTIYLIFIIINLQRAIIRKNNFMLALILYAIIANFFNRVLFFAPLSIIPYYLIALFNWEKPYVSYDTKKENNFKTLNTIK